MNGCFPSSEMKLSTTQILKPLKSASMVTFPLYWSRIFAHQCAECSTRSYHYHRSTYSNSPKTLAVETYVFGVLQTGLECTWGYASSWSLVKFNSMMRNKKFQFPDGHIWFRSLNTTLNLYSSCCNFPTYIHKFNTVNKTTFNIFPFDIVDIITESCLRPFYSFWSLYKPCFLLLQWCKNLWAVWKYFWKGTLYIWGFQYVF